MLVLGLDFGGTKLAAGVVDLVSVRLIDASLVLTRPGAGASGTVAGMKEMAKKLEWVDSIDGVGVCFGGYVYQGRILHFLYIESGKDFQLGNHLATISGSERYASPMAC